jgi:hypothetical protein
VSEVMFVLCWHIVNVLFTVGTRIFLNFAEAN